jgi:hypothetical protein
MERQIIIKIDIEGADILCLLDLFDADAPQFISIERPRDLGEQLFAWQLLCRLGYKRFQLIDQWKVPKQHHPILRFQPGDSGLFGDELPPRKWSGMLGIMARSAWIDARAIIAKAPVVSRLKFGSRWFDIHAAKAA